MAESNLSLYKHVKIVEGSDVLPFDLFLEGIKSGMWQDYVLPIRAMEKKEREEAKKRVPLVTLSGVFKKRNDESIDKHSGYIGIDIDDIDPEVTKELLWNNKYIYAMFTSISGRGLCLVFQIQPAKHREAFKGISQYLYEEYQLICDPTSVNVSRARFVSFDPHIYINPNIEKFTQYPKDKPPKKIEKIVFAESDFDNIINEICSRRLNLCESYHDWLRIGFAIASKFGEAGRRYYHLISQHSSKYSVNSTDKQYDVMLKRDGSGVSIATFYYYCKNAGIPLYSEQTKTVIHTAAHGKKGGLSKEKVAENLKKFEGIENVGSIIDQVFANDIELHDGIIQELELWLRQNYEFKRNSLTRYIENHGRIMEGKDFNTVFIAAKKVMQDMSYELMDRLINSDFVPTYNPLIEFIEENKHRQGEGSIEKLFSSLGGDQNFVQYFGKKWLVSIISSIYGEHSPLMLILTGETQNTGKTEFFRRLLPEPLKKFYAESKLDREKDDEILMTQKLIIMDDEMGGKSKKESKRLKELTSKQVFSLREPYGRNNVDLVRLAVLCGTSNDNELLNDPTGNRRIIPFHVTAINHEVYNSVNKTDLFMEAYHLWASGYEWKLNKQDIEYLGHDKISFEITNMEKELIQKYFTPGDDVEMSASEIKIYLEDKTRQKLILDKIGKELKSMGYRQKKIDSGTRRVYCLKYTMPDSVPGPF